MQAATVVTGVALGPGSVRIALSAVVQNRRTPVIPGLAGAAPTTKESLFPPAVEIPTALKTYPLLPAVPVPAFATGSSRIHAELLEGVQGVAPPISIS